MTKHTKNNASVGGTADEDEPINDGNEMENDGDSQDETDETTESDDNTDNVVTDDEVQDVPDEPDKDDDDTGAIGKADIGDDEPDGETCLYNIKQKIDSGILESDEFDNKMFGDEKIVQTKKVVAPNDRITRPFLTKYERVRLLSERRKQLILGAKPMIRVDIPISEKEIANLELNAKVIPLIIIRTLPNGNIEHWKLDELTY